MNQFEIRGNEIRELAKALVLDFMESTPECRVGGEGIKLAHLFRACGFDWGSYPKASSSNQQYWVVAIVQELQEEGRVERVSESGPWRLVSLKNPGNHKG